jgi:hypothetical protein
MQGINTFVVRVCPPGAGGVQEPIGTVEHVDLRRHYAFRGAKELMQLLLGKWGTSPGNRSTAQRRAGRDGSEG